MKQRSINNGSNNNDWETPQYIYDYVIHHFFNDTLDYFDPCPLNADFDGLKISWKLFNYINPPYNRKCKEAFIIKAYNESKLGKLCVMLIPAVTETKIFHDIIVPNSRVLLIKERIAFKGYNSK